MRYHFIESLTNEYGLKFGDYKHKKDKLASIPKFHFEDVRKNASFENKENLSLNFKCRFM